MTGMIGVFIGVQASVVVCSQEYYRPLCFFPFSHQVEHIVGVLMPFHVPTGLLKRLLDVSLHSLVAGGAWVARPKFYLVEHVLICALAGKMQ